MAADSYPLAWPDGWTRTESYKRSNYSRFKTTFDVARRKLHDELRKLGATNVVVSTNLELRRDGNPRADIARRRIGDPGVAVYFTHRKRQMVMARDAYENVHDNLMSICHAIDHLRGLERHGGATMMERAFEGFAALPEPGNTSHARPWWKVFDFQQDPSNVAATKRAETLVVCEVTYKNKAKIAHPDLGGSDAQMAELNAAIKKAREALS